MLKSWFGGAEFSHLLFVKLLISPSYLNEILAGYSNLGYRLFSFIISSFISPAIRSWPEEFLLKDQLFSLWGHRGCYLLLFSCCF